MYRHRVYLLWMTGSLLALVALKRDLSCETSLPLHHHISIVTWRPPKKALERNLPTLLEQWERNSQCEFGKMSLYLDFVKLQRLMNNVNHTTRTALCRWDT